MTKIITSIFIAVAIFMVVDFMCFIGWVYSGQKPVDNFYVGSVSAHIVQALIK